MFAVSGKGNLIGARIVTGRAGVSITRPEALSLLIESAPTPDLDFAARRISGCDLKRKIKMRLSIVSVVK